MRSKLLAALAVGIVATACGSDVPRGDDGQLLEPTTISVFDLAVGDCFNDPSQFEEVTDLDAMPCDVTHDNEVYAIVTHPLSGEDWPGQDVIDSGAATACLDRFDSFVGTAYADSRLDIAYFTPVEDGWDAGDDEVVCFLYDLNFEPLTGTMRSSGE